MRRPHSYQTRSVSRAPVCVKSAAVCVASQPLGAVGSRLALDPPRRCPCVARSRVGSGVCWVPWLSHLMLFPSLGELPRVFPFPFGLWVPFSLCLLLALWLWSVVPKVALQVTEVARSLFQVLLCSSENDSSCSPSRDSLTPCSPSSGLLLGPRSEFWNGRYCAFRRHNFHCSAWGPTALCTCWVPAVPFGVACSSLRSRVDRSSLVSPVLALVCAPPQKHLSRVS